MNFLVMLKKINQFLKKQEDFFSLGVEEEKILRNLQKIRKKKKNENIFYIHQAKLHIYKIIRSNKQEFSYKFNIFFWSQCLIDFNIILIYKNKIIIIIIWFDF